MTAPLVLNLALSAIVAIYFLWIGINNKPKDNTAREFFLMSGSLESNRLSTSFAAASTSVGTVIFFFVTLGLNFGALILWAPLTLLIGTLLFTKFLLPRIPDYFFNSFSAAPANTLSKFLFERFQNRTVPILVLMCAIAGLMSILVIEIFIGVQIFSIYLGPAYQDFALILIVFVVGYYASTGGMRAVVATDRIQFIIVAIPVLILFLWLMTEGGGFSAANDRALWFPSSTGIVQPLPWPLILNIATVNLLLAPALLRTWQMAASSNRQDVGRGMIAGAGLTVLVTALLIALGVVFYRVSFPNTQDIGLVGILDTLATTQNTFLNYVVFPSLFVACLAAIFSTVDSALLPIIHSVWSELHERRQEKKGEPNAETGAVELHGGSIYVLIVLSLALLLYFGVFRVLGFDVVSWMFTIFSFSIVTAPTIIAALVLDTETLRSRLGRLSAIISVVAALFVAIAITLIGNRTGNLAVIQWNSPLAALVGAAPLITLWYVKRHKRS